MEHGQTCPLTESLCWCTEEGSLHRTQRKISIKFQRKILEAKEGEMDKVCWEIKVPGNNWSQE